MKRFSKKAPFEEAICPSCGEWKTTDFTPQELQEKEWECSDCMNKRLTNPADLPENRGSKEISIYDDAYIFLKKLVLLVGKAVPESVPDIKALSQAHPFQTVDDAGDLAAQIWTLATEKYNIPREWLIKKLPEKKGSLKTASDELPCICGCKLKDHYFAGTPQEFCKFCAPDCMKYKPQTEKKADLWPAQQEASEGTITQGPGQIAYNNNQEKDTSVSGPNPNDQVKESSPETDHQQYIAHAQNIIEEYFFEKGLRFSQVVSFLKKLVPQLTEEDIAILKEDTKQKLSQFGQKIEAKRKSLNIDKAVQILDSKEPKVVRIDPAKALLELSDGTTLTFDQAVRKAMEIDKTGVFSGAEFSTTDFNVNPTLDLGPYSSPEDHGAKPQKSPFPNTGWLPADDENLDEQPWSNVAASKDTGHGQVPRSKATWRVKLFDGRGVQYFPDEESAKKYYEVALKEDKDPSKPAPFIYKKEAYLKINKSESGYVDNGKGYTCGRCAYFNSKENKCALVQGEIKAQGCCNYWDDKAQLKQEGPGYTKEEAAYIEYPNVDYRCDECIFFDPKAKTCTKVEGEISPIASCNLWQPMNKKQSFSKKELSKVANPSTRYWIAPDGTEFPVSGIHPVWLLNNGKILKKYGINPKQATYEIHKEMLNKGWVRISNEGRRDGNSFQIEVGNISAIPSFVDDFISKNYEQGETILIGDGVNKGVFVKDPFPSIQKAVNKELSYTHASLKQAGSVSNIGNAKVYKNPSFSQAQSILNTSKDKMIRAIIDPETHDLFIWDAWDAEHSQIVWNLGIGSIDFDNEGDVENYLWTIGTDRNELENLFELVNEYKSKATKKQADLSGQVVNEILKGIETSGGITYNLQQGNLAGTPNFSVSIYPDREQIADVVDFDTLEGYVEANKDLLSDQNNSFGAWTNNGKVYLDVVQTIPDKEQALELARKNNQLAIWDLAQGQEILTGITRAFSKKQLNKKAEESPLTQEDQNQIAAKWCPAMNILINNYAEAVKRGHSKDRSLEYALYSIQNIDKSINEKQAVEAINAYL